MLGRSKDSGLMAVQLHPDRVDVARVTRNGARPRVELCASFQRRVSELETLSELRRQLHLDRYRCTTLLSAGDYQLQLLDAPNVPAEEVKSATRWRLKDYLDYPVDAATVDVISVPADPNAPAPPARLDYCGTAARCGAARRPSAMGRGCPGDHPLRRGCLRGAARRASTGAAGDASDGDRTEGARRMSPAMPHILAIRLA